MYKRLSTQLVVAAFQKEETANECLKEIGETMAEGNVTCTNLAICVKKSDGKIRVKELGKPGPVKGADAGTTAGAEAGTALGDAALMFLGPIKGITGAAIGSTATLTSKGMNKDRLKSLGSALKPGSAAIVCVFDEVIVKKSTYRDDMGDVREDYEKKLLKMNADIHQNLKNGKNVAYVIAIALDGTSTFQKTVSEDAVHIKGLVLTTDEAKVGEVDVTDEGAAVSAAAVTAEGEAGINVSATAGSVMYEVAADTNDEGLHEAGFINPEDVKE